MIKSKFHQCSVHPSYDLRQVPEPKVIGRLDANNFQCIPENIEFRPKYPLDEGIFNMEFMCSAPMSLLELYCMAKKDLDICGYDSTNFVMYPLIRSSNVPTGEQQQPEEWHIDLRRLLRVQDEYGRHPVAFMYGVASVLPTIFLTGLDKKDIPKLTVADVSKDTSLIQQFAKHAIYKCRGFQAQPYEVVRYSSLNIHQAARNNGSQSMPRTFLNLAFVQKS